MAINERAFPALKRAWDEYGHSVAFADLHAAKTDSRNCYAVVCWKSEENEGMLAIADLARTGLDAEWEMQNDGFFEDITERDWRKLEIVPDCDWFTIPGNPHYER